MTCSTDDSIYMIVPIVFFALIFSILFILLIVKSLRELEEIKRFQKTMEEYKTLHENHIDEIRHGKHR